MNRLLVFVASVGLACLAISSTCLAGPADWGTVASSRLLADDGRSSAAGWSASFAPSQMVSGGLLSL